MAHLSAFWGAEEGLLVSPRVVPGLGGARDLAVGDLDRDRKPELVVSRSDPPFVKAYPWEGSPVAIYTQKGFSSLEVLDLDGDGSPDLLGTNFSSGEVVAALLDARGGVRGEMALPAGTYPSLVRVERLDADEMLDLLAVSTGSSQLTVFLGRGGGAFAAARPVTTIALPRSAALGDLDGDGRVDVAVSTTDEVAVQYGDGAGGFGPPESVDRDLKKRYVQ